MAFSLGFSRRIAREAHLTARLGRGRGRARSDRRRPGLRGTRSSATRAAQPAASLKAPYEGASGGGPICASTSTTARGKGQCHNPALSDAPRVTARGDRPSSDGASDNGVLCQQARARGGGILPAGGQAKKAPEPSGQVGAARRTPDRSFHSGPPPASYYRRQDETKPGSWRPAAAGSA